MSPAISVARPGCFLLLLVSVMISSCNSRREEVKGVTEKEAVELAKKEALKNGVKAERYELRVSLDKSGKTWLICFDEPVDPTKYRAPQGRYFAIVEKDTGEVRFMMSD